MLSDRERVALASWRTAPDGSLWPEIDAAWEILFFLMEAAESLDRKELS